MKLFQDSRNLVINTAEGKGDMFINGRSLKGLFATVADLEDDVNTMTTVGDPPAQACAAARPRARRVVRGCCPVRWVGRKLQLVTLCT